MPNCFSHTIAAEKIFERLPTSVRQKIKDKTLYLLAAQGGDLFFIYSCTFSNDNLGKELHRMNPKELFTKLKEGDLSFAAGFATHYALDSVLHPAVYAYADKHRSPLAHTSFETDLGLFISKYFATRRTLMPREHILEKTAAVYDSIKLVLPEVTMTGIERGLKRYFMYMRHSYNTKKQSYKCDYDFSNLAHLVETAIDKGVKCVESVINGEIDDELFEASFLQR